jgi:cytochrome P450
MSEAMLGIVLGEGAPARMAQDVQAVFAAVPKPLSRLLKGRKLEGRRRRLYEDLRAQWNRENIGPCLLADARAHHPEPTQEMLEQIPHWMFTFSDSGTDLVARTLAMIRARPDVARKVRAEVASAGPLDRVPSVEGLRYVEACLLETGRLYPPVRIATYQTGRPHRDGSLDVAKGTRIVNHLPVLHRPAGASSDEESFRPERWLAVGAQPPYSVLFLQGPRQCPGRDLITFVCKAAVAQAVSASAEGAAYPTLAGDPVPDHFPAGAQSW